MGTWSVDSRSPLDQIGYYCAGCIGIRAFAAQGAVNTPKYKFAGIRIAKVEGLVTLALILAAQAPTIARFFLFAPTVSASYASKASVILVIVPEIISEDMRLVTALPAAGIDQLAGCTLSASRYRNTDGVVGGSEIAGAGRASAQAEHTERGDKNAS